MTSAFPPVGGPVGATAARLLPRFLQATPPNGGQVAAPGLTPDTYRPSVAALPYWGPFPAPQPVPSQPSPQVLAEIKKLQAEIAQINALLTALIAGRSATPSPAAPAPGGPAPVTLPPVAPPPAPPAPPAPPPPPPAPPAPPPAPPAPPPAPPAPPPAAEAPKPATDVVQGGDSLSAIAQRVLGDGNRWRELYELNRDVIGDNPNVIHAGQELRLPGGATPAPAPAPAPGPGTPVKAPYINQYHPAGEAQGYTNGPSNCGPTSMAIIGRAFGYGEGMSDAKLINHLGAIGGTTGAGTSVGGLAKMAQKMGLTAETRGPGPQVGWIAEQLRAGKMVVANGDYHEMNPHRNVNKTSGHYVAVVGIEADGTFLVHDPADKNVHRVSQDEMARFIRSNPNGGYQTAIGR